MLRSFRAYGLLFLFFILLATGVFRCVLEDDKVFSGSDMNIGLLTINHQRLPERFFGGYSSVPVMGNAGTTPLTFSNLGKSFLDPVLFSNIWYSLFLIVSSISLIAYLRLFNIRWLAALLGAVSAFWVGSITLSSAGHLYKLGVMAFYSLSLYLLERSMRSENLWKAFGLATSAGLCVGLMLLEQQDVGLFAGLVLGSYVLVRMIQLHGKNWIRWGIILLPVALIGGGLSATTALRAYNQNVVATDLKRDSVQQWNFVTQWSMVPSELPDLIAPGYTGWKTGSPEGPYWGKIGESPEWETMRKGFMNFRLDSLYIGVIPVFLALLGTIVSMGRYKNKEDRVFLLWSALALVTLLLALGKYTFLYKPFYSLPLVGNIRAPIKFLHNFQAIIGILAAFGAHHMLCADKERRDGKVKVFMFAAAGFAVVAAILSLQALSGSFKEEFSQWGNYASLICKNISKAWLHASIMGAVLALVGFLTWKKLAVPKQGLLVLLIGMVVFDSIFLTSKYFEALDMSGLRKGNAVLNYLKEYQGDNRIYFLRSDGPYASWISMESQYHGVNKFNIWQMPRMPSEYKTFLGAAERNPVRMWQLASIRYIAAPIGILEQISKDGMLAPLFKPVMYYRFLKQENGIGVVEIPQPKLSEDQVLLEFDSLPRFALFHDWKVVAHEEQCKTLFSKTFDPNKTVLIDAVAGSYVSMPNSRYESVEASTTTKDATIHTSSKGDGVLLFTQRFQDGWKVYVDGVPSEVLRCNYLCMGVWVPSGTHEVRFVYR